MKILKEFNIKKILKLLRIGTFKKSIFLILFGMYFSTLAFAAALTVSFKGGLIPGGNNNFINPDSPKCRSSTTGDLLTFDRTTDPSDVQFSDDGLIVFSKKGTIPRFMISNKQKQINNLSSLEAFKIFYDMIFNSIFDSKEIETERDVIKEEYIKEKNDSSSLIEDLTMKTVLRNTKYQYPIIGYLKTINKINFLVFIL